jgi:hypothetical protein
MLAAVGKKLPDKGGLNLQQGVDDIDQLIVSVKRA